MSLSSQPTTYGNSGFSASGFSAFDDVEEGGDCCGDELAVVEEVDIDGEIDIARQVV